MSTSRILLPSGPVGLRPSAPPSFPLRRVLHRRSRLRPLRAEQLKENTAETSPDTSESAEQNEAERVTKKWGLEAGLFKAVTSKDKQKGTTAGTAKELLKKYGSAYLITSISFAIVSFALCYLLVDIGVDVAALLAKIGISVTATSEKVGTAAIAYAAHKAASPIRFPPTVALTPVVANWLGRKKNEDSNEES